MSRFNTPALARKDAVPDTHNLAGGQAHAQDPKVELASLLLTNFVTDQFYRDSGASVARLKELLKTVDPKFAAKAAIFARNEFGMRSISHVVAGEIAGTVSGEQWTKNFHRDVVRRPDDMTEIVSYYLATYGKPLPAALKKGLAAAFAKFDGYQLAKYRGDGKGVSLVDVVNLVRPRSSSKNASALKRLIEDSLVSEWTYEAKLSAAGAQENVAEAKAEAWRELLTSREIGYMALLKNLRNIQDQAPDLIPLAVELLTDPKLVGKSLVLPFRYLVAQNEVTDRRLIAGLSEAIDVALVNVPVFDGKTLVVVDHSGSMGQPVAQTSLPCQYVGDVFAAAMAKRNDADVMVFGSNAGYVRAINPSDSTLTVARQIGSMAPPGGHGTNFHSIFQQAQWAYDRVVIFSDMQAWMGYHTPADAFASYKQQYRANPFVYAFDLAGHGTLQFPLNRVFQLAGFSDKVFDTMRQLEQDPNALVTRIEAIQL